MYSQILHGLVLYTLLIESQWHELSGCSKAGCTITAVQYRHTWHNLIWYSLFFLSTFFDWPKVLSNPISIHMFFFYKWKLALFEPMFFLNIGRGFSGCALVCCTLSYCTLSCRTIYRLMSFTLTRGICF